MLSADVWEFGPDLAGYRVEDTLTVADAMELHAEGMDLPISGDKLTLTSTLPALVPDALTGAI